MFLAKLKDGSIQEQTEGLASGSLEPSGGSLGHMNQEALHLAFQKMSFLLLNGSCAFYQLGPRVEYRLWQEEEAPASVTFSFRFQARMVRPSTLSLDKLAASHLS